MRSLPADNATQTMAQEVSPTDVGIQTSDNFDRFLEIIQAGTKDEVDTFLSRLIGTAKEASKCSAREIDHSKQLADALEDNNVVEVWKLIAKANENENGETLENLTEVCRTIAEKENKKDECKCNFQCGWDCKELCKTVKSAICWIVHCDEDDLEQETEMRSTKEQKWIKILSHPLYISLEWLWRNNPESRCKKDVVERKESKFADKSECRESGIRRKSKFADIIEASLDDAYLLKKIALYEHHYSRDEYKKQAMEYEKFATDIVEQIDTADLNQLHEIMDIKGNGSLLKKKPINFNQSLSLLKMAADKNRKWVGIRLY